MPPPPPLLYPFLTRDMLAFEHGIVFELRIDMQADTIAELSIRGMTREATFEYKATTGNDSLISSEKFALSDIPIYVTIEDTNHDLDQGAAFVTISLLANGVVVQQLTSGYLYAQKALSWPNTQQVDLRPNGGRIQRKIPTTPSPGHAIEITVPSGEVWRVQDMTFILTTSATVATRRVKVRIMTQYDETIATWSNTDQTASQSRVYHMADYGVIQDEAEGSDILITLPSAFVLIGGDTIRIDASSIQSGDQFNPAEITIEKYFTTPS